MITSANEYYSALFKVNNNGNIPSLAVLLPNDERIYKIDLETRTIESPEFLSVLDDHVAETVYFLVDRFYDNVDLSTTSCIIQYINAKGDERIYQVPFYDIETYRNIEEPNGSMRDKMLIPWCIEGEATKVAGDITYSIRFYKIDEVTQNHLLFNLNTLPAVSKIKNGLRVTDIYIRLDELTALDFINNKGKYYIKNNEGDFELASSYSKNETYYVLYDEYDYYANKYESLSNMIDKLKRGNQCYWYNASEF